jgi:hypothetical protein
VEISKRSEGLIHWRIFANGPLSNFNNFKECYYNIKHIFHIKL